MNKDIKIFWKALFILKAEVECTAPTVVKTEEDFNKILWNTGEVDSTDGAVTTTTCPHAEITWSKLKIKIDEVKSEYDALDYSRNRATTYPVTKDFMEAYTEKEIGGDDTKWNEYVTKYNQVRTDNPKG